MSSGRQRLHAGIIWDWHYYDFFASAAERHGEFEIHPVRMTGAWGVINSPTTPNGCWVHESALRSLRPNTRLTLTSVHFTCEQIEHEGYQFRAIEVWPPPRSQPRPEIVTIDSRRDKFHVSGWAADGTGEFAPNGFAATIDADADAETVERTLDDARRSNDGLHIGGNVQRLTELELARAHGFKTGRAYVNDTVRIIIRWRPDNDIEIAMWLRPRDAPTNRESMPVLRPKDVTAAGMLNCLRTAVNYARQ